MRQGRPLWFLAGVLGGWTALRVVMLWPEAVVDNVAERRRFGTPRFVSRPVAWAPVPVASNEILRPKPRVHVAVAMHKTRPASVPIAFSPAASLPEPRVAVLPRPVLPERIPVFAPLPAFALAEEARAASPRPRLAGSFWVVARPSGGENLAFGQLGASQAGLRLTYALDQAHTVAASARVSAPLRGHGREAGVGVDWRPTALPLHLLAEARVPLDGGPARPAAAVIGGTTQRLGLGLVADAYGQAGAVYRRGAFADGAVRVTRTLLDLSGAELAAGAAGWGAAQRGAARLDVGPTAGVSVPVGRAFVRVSADYRLRALGAARPGSGPAISLGAGF